ncbi:hypothetical protein ABFS83_07G037400 [Erythranthe nasuta]
MATQFHTLWSSRAAAPLIHRRQLKSPFLHFSKETRFLSKQLLRNYNCNVPVRISRISAAAGGGDGGRDSYLDMWQKAVDREKMSVDFERMAENPVESGGKEESDEELERRNREFQNLLQVPPEERDRVQRMQVIDRAAAAIAAARALVKENSQPGMEVSGEGTAETGGGKIDDLQEGNSSVGTPGPSFWAWTPPPSEDIFVESKMKPAAQISPPPPQVLEQDRSLDILSIPFETSTLQNTNKISLPPLQSLLNAEEARENELGVQFSAHAAEAADALSEMTETPLWGVNPDGSRWWKETGVERRSDGVVCKWTLTRGVSADEAIEWENKYWEAADEFGYKELGSEKSGRDSLGSVWREYWRESMMQIEGLVHFEKTADKWGKNLQGDEWHEKWWEHYDASGRADKWAHKWCSIDPETPLEDGHAHIWHERWGEKYDGHGGSTKYTDKWAERFEGNGWSKWGDKWDENFDPNGLGVKQGEKWWEGKDGARWNRTWGEGHNGSGWIHKYGKSSCGEHWDTHVEQETWYERFPHFGFYHCFENSVQLREVEKPSE